MKVYDVQKPAAMDVNIWNQEFHKTMLTDSQRMDAFHKAIFEKINPGDVVVDLGTGTGILAKWALQAGAKRVYGIDYNKDILAIAEKDLLEFGDQFIPILGNSLNITIPERVDVIISETIGNFGDNENCIEYLKDAKKRFLKEGGTLIPENITQFAVLVDVPKVQENIKNTEVLNYYETIIPEIDYCSKKIKINEFQFNEDENIEYEKEVVFNINNKTSITGMKGWFTAKLSDNIYLDTEFVKQDSSWNHFYIPINFLGDFSNKNEIKITIQKKNNNYFIRE